MPSASRTTNKKQLTRNTVRRKFPVSSLKFKVPKEGFTLVEILLSLFFIIAIVTILFSTSGSLLTRRQSDLQSIAAKIATKEIERLRSVPFTNFQNGTEGNFNCGNNGDPDLTKLRAGCLARIVTDYGDGPPINSSTKIVQVTVEVRWNNDNNVQKNLRMDTLIYESGL